MNSLHFFEDVIHEWLTIVCNSAYFHVTDSTLHILLILLHLRGMHQLSYFFFDLLLTNKTLFRWWANAFAPILKSSWGHWYIIYADYGLFFLVMFLNSGLRRWYLQIWEIYIRLRLSPCKQRVWRWSRCVRLFVLWPSRERITYLPINKFKIDF